MEKSILKDKKRNNSNLFLVLFAVLFVVLVGGAFWSHDGVGPVGDVMTSEPIEMTFSDVLRRSGEIKTMKIEPVGATIIE